MLNAIYIMVPLSSLMFPVLGVALLLLFWVVVVTPFVVVTAVFVLGVESVGCRAFWGLGEVWLGGPVALWKARLQPWPLSL